MELTKDTPISELLHSNDELTHYGIPGMKWGVRRYQNEDGSLTPKGKERYRDTKTGHAGNYIDQDGWGSPPAKTKADDELAERINNAWVSHGREYVRNMPLLDRKVYDLEPVPFTMPEFNLSDYKDKF